MRCWFTALQIGLAAIFLNSSMALAEAGSSVTVTIYNQNRALITEVRKMTIPKGLNTVEFSGVAETIDPASLQVRSLTSPNGFKILDQNYEYDLINVQNLLNKFVGKQLKVVMPDPKGSKDSRMIVEARLLANNDRPIFRIEEPGPGSSTTGAGEIYVGDYAAVLLPAVPEGLRPHPTLVWLTENQGEEEQQIEVSYLAESMNWRADYVLKLDRENTGGALSGWVTLDNQSGKTFEDARLKLVAGDVHLAPRQKTVPEMEARKRMASAQAEEGMRAEEFFEYHLYSLERTVDLANRQTKQVSLLQSPRVKMEKHLLGQWDSMPHDGGERSLQKEKIEVLLRFRNSEEDGLGVPLPKGIVRAYQESGDGTVIFIGEDSIDHSGKDAEVELHTGDSFDVVVERRQTDHRKVGAHAVRYAWEMKVKNSKDVSQKVELVEVFPGDWKIVQSSMNYQKLDARRVKFVVDTPPSSKGKDTVVTYEAEVSW